MYFFLSVSDMERTVKALDHVINFYMVSRELADLIQGGPHTTSTDALNIYLEVSRYYKETGILILF